MNAKARNNTKLLDTIFWVIVIALTVGGIGANYYFYAKPLAVRLIGWLILACIVLGIAVQTTFGQRAWIFLREARQELRRVTWPTRQETVQTTIIVIAMVVVMSLFLWGLDSILLWAIAILTGQRG